MKRSILGFVIAPFAPPIAFTLLAAAFGTLTGLKEAYIDKEGVINIFAIIFGSLGWLIFSLPVSYALAIFLGIPMHLFFRKRGLTTLRAYLTGPAILGGSCALIPLLAGRAMPSQGMVILVAGAFFGMIAGGAFWLIVYKRPLIEDVALKE